MATRRLSRPLVFDEMDDSYIRNGLHPYDLTDLESIGLIQYEFIGYAHERLSKTNIVRYYERQVVLNLPKETNNQLDMGRVILTKVGKELAPVCGSKPVGLF